MTAATKQTTDDTERMLSVLPPRLREAVRQDACGEGLIEIVADLGRTPEARFPGRIRELCDQCTTQGDIDYIVNRVGQFTDDNRAGIERTLHRISAIRNRHGTVIGLTCRIGRAVFGTVEILRDVIESGHSILLLGRPGVGKTTLLRESARVLADELQKRVIIVDTSNEIGGDGDIPHPGIGRARRMQVPSIHQQHSVMIEAVENHMPEVIVIDEIGTGAEAFAARTIAERGVQLIATAHGNNLENLLANPTLSDLIGGISPVTLSDEEARRRKSRKTILERKAPPTFDVLVEIQDRDRMVVHFELGEVIDAMLLGKPAGPEVRQRGPEGSIISRKADAPVPPRSVIPANKPESEPGPHQGVRIFTYGVSRKHMQRAVANMGVFVHLVSDMESADIVLTLKSQEKKKPLRLREVQKNGMPVHVIRNNTITQIENFLRSIFPGAAVDRRTPRESASRETSAAEELAAEKEAEKAVIEIYKTGLSIELSPRNARFRRLQHEFINHQGLSTESRGKDPNRRVVAYPGHPCAKAGK